MKHRQRLIRGDPTASRDRYARRCRTSLARGFAEDGWLAGRGHVRGSAQLHVIRFFGTLRLAERPFCPHRPLPRQSSSAGAPCRDYHQ